MTIVIGTDEAAYELTLSADGRPKWGVLCGLTQAPLAYLDTAPGGEKPTRTSLRASVSGFAAPWIEQRMYSRSMSRNLPSCQSISTGTCRQRFR